MIRFGFLLIAIISACSLSDSDLLKDVAINDSLLKDDGGYDSAGEGGLIECVYIDKYVCDYCGENIFEDKNLSLIVGCRAELDCKLFCTDNMPNGYRSCYDDEWCAYWDVPQVPFSSCEKYTDYDYFDEAYSCACPHAGQMYTAAYHPDYGCKVFITTCFAEGFASNSSCDLPQKN